MRRRLLSICFFLIILIFLLIGWFSLRFFYIPISQIATPITFVVPTGMRMPQVVERLHQQGILNDPYYFLLLAKLRGDLTRIKSGEYKLNPYTTPAQLLKKLVNGERVLYKITFVEGWTFKQIMAAIQANPKLIHTLPANAPESVMAAIGHPQQNPEGLFYPDTYLFGYGTKDSKILTMAYELLQKKLAKAWQTRAANLPYQNPYEALIVASMVEKETANAQERPLVAGVIVRRLQKNMPLQIDATVIYGMGSDYHGMLLRRDLLVDSSYNTYTRKGLPPTPIAMPCHYSIEAALHPSGGTALYYMARGNGTHVFSNTLQAHDVAMANYRAFKKNQLKAPRLGTPQLSTVAARLMINYWLFVGESQAFFSQRVLSSSGEIQ